MEYCSLLIICLWWILCFALKNPAFIGSFMKGFYPNTLIMLVIYYINVCECSCQKIIVKYYRSAIISLYTLTENFSWTQECITLIKQIENNQFIYKSRYNIMITAWFIHACWLYHLLFGRYEWLICCSCLCLLSPSLINWCSNFG